MLPQKNSGNRAAKKNRESGASIKNRKEADSIFSNINELGERKHISRVTRTLGNGRVEIFYVKKENNAIRSYNSQGIIRGSFRGRGKRDVWINVGSFVIVEENLGVLEIVGVLTREQMKDIVSLDNTYAKVLYLDGEESNEPGIEFENNDEEDNNVTTTVIVSKKDKVKHSKQNVPVEAKEDVSDIDIDDI
jgi:hypothetical protein